MALAQDKTLTANQALRVVKQLPPSEFEKFTTKFNRIHSKPKTKSLSKKETELLMKINEGIPDEIRQRYDKLYRKWKRDMDALPKAEYEELLQLNQKVEELNAKRIGYLAELSILWKKPLQDVMDKLGIKTPSYD